MRRALRVVAACSLPIALLAACGSDGDESTDGTEETEDTETENTEETEDTEGEDTEDTETEDTEAPAETSGGDSPEPGGAGCQVTVEGEVSTSFSSSDDVASVSYGAWVAEDVREMLGLDESSLILNCGSGTPSISFLGGGEGRPPIPMEPATYTIPGDQGILGSEGTAITVLMTLEDGKVHGMAEDGTFTITTFTDEVIEGSFELPVSEQFTENDVEGATSTVRGTFRLTNHN